VEDVCNNFSTTQKLREIIESRGAKLVAITCAINRSGTEKWDEMPVISSVFSPTEQFRQSEPEVIKLVRAGKVVWKPKQQWAELKKAMRK